MDGREVPRHPSSLTQILTFIEQLAHGKLCQGNDDAAFSILHRSSVFSPNCDVILFEPAKATSVRCRECCTQRNSLRVLVNRKKE